MRLGIASICVVLAVAAPAFAADDVAAARHHFRQGSKLFDLERYRDAVEEFKKAYEAKDDPAFLFNIAQAYRLSNQYAEALHYYKSFLGHVPDAPNRALVEERIAELTTIVEQQNATTGAAPHGTMPPAEHPTETPPPPPPRTVSVARVRPAPPAAVVDEPGRGKRIAGLVVGGAGLALIGVGAAFGVLAMQAGDSLTHPTAGQTFDPSVEASGQSDQTVAVALLVAGGVAVAAGATLALLGYRERGAGDVALLPSVAPGRAGAALRVRF